MREEAAEDTGNVRGKDTEGRDRGGAHTQRGGRAHKATPAVSAAPHPGEGDHRRQAPPPGLSGGAHRQAITPPEGVQRPPPS